MDLPKVFHGSMPCLIHEQDNARRKNYLFYQEATKFQANHGSSRSGITSKKDNSTISDKLTRKSTKDIDLEIEMDRESEGEEQVTWANTRRSEQTSYPEVEIKEDYDSSINTQKSEDIGDLDDSNRLKRNGQTPLTFAQAREALNQLSANSPGHNTNYRTIRAHDVDAVAGSPSAQRNFVEIAALPMDYEDAFEAKIHEQDVLLEMMRAEKLSWEGRIENALRYRCELERQLKLYREGRTSSPKSPFVSQYAGFPDFRSCDLWGIPRSPNARYSMPSVMWVNAGPDEAPVYPSDCLNAKTYSGPFKTMDYPSPTRLVTKSNSQSALNQIRSVEWSSIRPSSNSSHRQLSSSERSLASQSRIRGGRTYSRDLPVTGAKTTFTADFSRGNVNDPHWRTVRIDVADPEGVRSFRRNRQYNVQTKNIPANPNSTVTDYLGGANELDQLDDAGDDEIAEICAKKLSPPNFDFTEAISGKKHGRKIPTLLEYSEDDVDSTTLSNSMKEAYGGKIKSSSTSNLRVAQSADRKQNSRPKDIGSYQSVKNSQEYRRKTIEIVRISSPSSHAQSAEEVDNRSPSISSNNSLNLQKTQVESTGTKSLHLDCSKEGQNSRSQNELRHKSTDSTEINIDTQKGSEIIYVNRPVTLLCLGPGAECRPASSDSMISGSREQLDECVALPHPLWVAVCTDNSSVSVFDLKTRRKKCSCFEHTCQSASPVIALIPFAYKSGNCISPDGDSVQGLLCIARKGGYLTLYNVSTCRVVGHLVLEHDILYAFPLLPCDPDASLMVISPDGQVVRCFWEITGYSEGQLFPKYTHWEGITKDMGANIVNVLSEKEKTNDFKCCICLQRATQSAASSPPNSSLISRKSLSNAYLLVAVSFIRAEKDLSILRICSWAARCNQLKLASCVDKAWNGASCSELVGVSYSELGGAPSVCICLKTEIIWLSLKVIAGTNKGEIHIVGVPKVLFACRMAGCLFGFPTKEDILYHLIRDHYMNDSGMANGDETHCSWPDCDFSIEDSEGRVNEEKLERHALQHLSSL